MDLKFKTFQACKIRIRVFAFLTLSCLVSSCIGKYKSESTQSANISEQAESPLGISADTINISLSNSKIFWKGTKMRGAGKHEGEIALNNGSFLIRDGQLKGGQFMVDMASLKVTDIPDSDPIPKKNLEDHLKNADFFDVTNYPIAKFEITKVKKHSENLVNISGNLTIKGITKNIEFIAENNNKAFSAKFTIDRFAWNIAYEGSWADKTLVDKDIELSIVVFTE